MEAGGQFIITLTLLTGLCSGQNVLPPGPVNGAVGGSVMINTNIGSAGPFLAISWNFNGGSGSVTVATVNLGGTTPGPGYEGRVSVSSTTGSLELKQLTLGDTGTYTVNLIPNSGGQLTGDTTLNVYEPVSNVTVNANATDLVELNDTVSLTCSASGTSLSYQWRNGSSDITAGGRVQLSDGGRILTISSVLMSDRGPLYCTVHNVVSTGTSQPILLNISYGPDNVEVAVDPLSEFYIPGSSVTLSCSAQSSPPAQFQWALNGKMLDREGQELKLENVQRNQSGSYICWAHNSITLRYTASKPSMITVLERISGAHITGPSEPLIAGNSSANLSCQAAAGTSISRKWLKGDQPLSPSNRITFSDDKSSVSISPVESSDNGEYQCRLSNPVSTDTASYTLTVNYGPEDVLIKGVTEVEVGQTVVLFCSAKSEPSATFTWTVNGTETSIMTAQYIKDNATYDDSGNYTCVAENAVTGLSRSSAVHVLTVGREGGPVSVSRPPLGAILGGVFGSLACVGLAAAVAVMVMKTKR
ncbi:hypothetical protein AGOR_G00212030 [Albula goreensis]|uniref:Ig-like domain-containing protein n=1 Tax=Albula goreensis TaxID=1534307 RepID=A0A8T3CR81_9TELE|nr:hypothetical protein AGOR_G00212030 [Albula goreensis]